MFSKSSQVQHIRRWDMVWSTEDEFGQRSSAEHCCITLFSQGGAPPPLWTVALVPPLDEVRCETRHVVSKTTTPSVRSLCLSCWGHHGEKRCIYYVHIELGMGIVRLAALVDFWSTEHASNGACKPPRSVIAAERSVFKNGTSIDGSTKTTWSVHFTRMGCRRPNSFRTLA